MKKIEELTDRELNEWNYRTTVAIEKHLKYFSTIITIYIVLTFVGICVGIYFATS